MAKKKKRDRGGSAESAGAVEIEAPAREPAAEVSARATVASAAVDRFNPFGDPRAQRLANVFIALFLAYMLAMPLRYYLGGRGLDERFSWRMFSSVRMLKCKVEVDEHLERDGDTRERKVNLTKEVQVAWIGLLERGRPLVIEKLLARRCAQPADQGAVVQVDYHLTCVAPDGSAGPSVDHHMKCADRRLASGRGEP